MQWQEWIIASRGKTGLAFCQLLDTTFLSARQHIPLFHVCFYLKTPYTVDWFALKLRPTELYLKLKWTLSNNACETPPNLLTPRNVRQLFSMTLKGHLREWNHRRNAHKSKNVVVNKAAKRTFSHSRRAKTRRQASPCSSPAGDMHVGRLRFSSLCSCPQMTTKTCIGLGVTNKFQQIHKFANYGILK